jgi:type VI secretion system protein ImpK
MNPLVSATQPCFGAITQMRHLDPSSLSSPEDLQRRLCGFVDEMRARLAGAGLHSQDVQDITYALVALADEVALNAGEPLAGYWMMNLLQFKYFHENTAGDGFFVRLGEVRKDARRKEVLKVYALCLLFGFQGRYRVRGGELELLTLVDSLQREALGARNEGEALSPRSRRAAEPASRSKRNVRILAVASAAVVLSLLVNVVLRFSLSRGMSSLEGDIATISHP